MVVGARGTGGRLPGRFHNGKLVEHWGVPDRLAVLLQLGMFPPQTP
jgi:hypothetical protein